MSSTRPPFGTLDGPRFRAGIYDLDDEGPGVDRKLTSEEVEEKLKRTALPTYTVTNSARAVREAGWCVECKEAIEDCVCETRSELDFDDEDASGRGGRGG